jgi:hypothetical protein
MFLLKRQSAFQAAPVSSHHSSFGADCAQCHDQSWRAVGRLLTFSDAYHSVSDAACRKCHQAADHVPGLLAPAACVTCHQEHRPDQGLTTLADSECTRCHRDLALEGQTAVSFVPQIRRFGDGRGAHPEFALLRTSDEHAGPRHLARSVAAYVPSPAAGVAGKWIDAGGLKFNHQVHLDPTQILGPGRESVRLTCADCHAPEPNGAYMRPIEYERHCQTCHPLKLAGSLSPLTAMAPLPHSSVEEVRGVLRERVARAIEQSPRGMGGGADQRPGESGVLPPRMPRLPSPARLTADQENPANAVVLRADHAVFGLEAKGMCRKCHHVEARGTTWHVSRSNPAILRDATATAGEAAMIPERWFRHGAFHHKRHRALELECARCHQVEQSRETADVLLPSISVCRGCHGASATSTSRVSADCVLCHTYHDDRGPHSILPSSVMPNGADDEGQVPTQ